MLRKMHLHSWRTCKACGNAYRSSSNINSSLQHIYQMKFKISRLAHVSIKLPDSTKEVYVGDLGQGVNYTGPVSKNINAFLEVQGLRIPITANFPPKNSPGHQQTLNILVSLSDLKKSTAPSELTSVTVEI